LTIYYILSLSTASFFGSLSDRIGRRTLLIIGTALAGVSFIPFPIVYGIFTTYEFSFWLLLLSNSLKGVAAAMVAGPVLAMFADIAPERNHGETMGKFYLAKSAGAASGFLIGGFTYDLFEQYSFYLFMIIMFGATALYIFRFSEPKSKFRSGDIDLEDIDFQEITVEPAAINPFKTVIQSLQNKQFQKFAIAWLAYSTLVGAALTYAPLVLTKVGGQTAILGVVFLVGAAFMGAIQPTIGKLSDSLGRKPFLIIGCVGMSLLVVMIAAILNLAPEDVVDLIFNPISITKVKSLEFTPGIAIPIPHLLIVFPLLIFLLSASCFASSSLGLISDVTEEGSRGREMGLTQAITSSGSIIGTIIGGWFFGISGILGVMTFCFGLSLIAIVVIFQFLYETSGFYHFTHKLV
jgi:MHS family proline/betaine transporter-like MFS transporter